MLNCRAWINYFFSGGLACDLVRVGVKEVTFSGERIFSCPIYNPRFLDLVNHFSPFTVLSGVKFSNSKFQQFSALELLLTFFKAGIVRITVNPEALIPDNIKTHIVEKFISVCLNGKYFWK